MQIDKSLSGPQQLALQSAIDHGSPTHHISGQSAWAGWGGTRAALQRRGFLDTACRITDAGRAAMGQPRLTDKPELLDQIREAMTGLDVAAKNVALGYAHNTISRLSGYSVPSALKSICNRGQECGCAAGDFKWYGEECRATFVGAVRKIVVARRNAQQATTPPPVENWSNGAD